VGGSVGGGKAGGGVVGGGFRKNFLWGLLDFSFS
jgi:hypothetical protein